MIKAKDISTFNPEADFKVVINGKEACYNLTWQDVDEDELTSEELEKYKASNEDSRKFTRTVIIEVE